MHWIYLLISIVGFALAYTSKSTALLALGLIAGFVGLIAAFVAMAAARIADRSRPDAALLTDADIAALRRSVQKNRKAHQGAGTPPPAPSGDPE